MFNFLNKKCFDTEYIIGYRVVDQKNTLIKNTKKNVFFTINASFDWWYADPLIFTFHDEVFIFMEAFDRNKNIGRIAVSKFENGVFSEPEVVLKEKFHLSFPFVFIRNENVFMIPETSASNEIRIYKSEVNLFHWKLYKKIKITNAVDSCIYKFKNREYLITSILSDNPLLTTEKIFLLDDDFNISECKFDNVETYPAFDVRNGGKIIELNGDCILPKQVSTSTVYGLFLKLYRVFIDKEQVKKEKIVEINKDSIVINSYPYEYNIIGVHTYGYESDIEVVDLCLNVARYRTIFRKIKKKVFGFFY